jgi:hypothetical protein
VKQVRDGFLVIEQHIKNKIKNMAVNKVEIWERQEDGTAILVRVEEHEVPDIDPIQQKEDELLKLYQELEILKQKSLE